MCVLYVVRWQSCTFQPEGVVGVVVRTWVGFVVTTSTMMIDARRINTHVLSSSCLVAWLVACLLAWLLACLLACLLLACAMSGVEVSKLRERGEYKYF